MCLLINSILPMFYIVRWDYFFHYTRRIYVSGRWENYLMIFIYFDFKKKDFAIKIIIKKKVNDMNITWRINILIVLHFNYSIPIISVYDLGYYNHDRGTIDYVYFHVMFRIIQSLRWTTANNISWISIWSSEHF